MLKGYIQADYSPENWKIMLDIKAAADTDIDNAATVADVMTALNHAQAAMAAVHTLLDDAKAAAHAGLTAAFAGYAEGDYSPKNWAILLEAVSAGETDNAASVADVTTALNNARAAMAAVHTLLDDARIAAHTGLEAALAAYTQADYPPDGWAALIGFKAAGDAAIDEAADPAGVEAARSAAEAGMGAVRTIAQALAEAKAAAHEALAAALGTQESDGAVDDGIALTAPEATGAAAAVAAVDQTEEPAAADLPAAPVVEQAQ